MTAAPKRLTQQPTLDVKVSLTLSYAEICALDALVGYGIEPFLKVFYEKLGTHYMRPYEAGLRSVFGTIREELPPVIKRTRAAARAFMLDDPVIRSRSDHDALVASAVAAARPKDSQ